MMKAKFVSIAAAVLFSSCAADKPALMQTSPKPMELSAKTTQLSEKYEPLNYNEQNAVWISYIELADMLDGTENDFRKEIENVFAEISELGLNTVYVHVRAFGDAFYDSKLFVKTKYLTQDFDPLEIMVQAAHENDLSFHAWINPLRCDTRENMERMKDTKLYEWYSQADKYPEYISLADDGYYWLDPAVPDVRKFIADGAGEIVHNYDVDGLHIDDYFYPTTDKSFDKQSYAAADTELSLDEWRMENCSELVKELYSAVKQEDDRLLFGVSPQGNIDNNYQQQYADVKRWCSESGFLDYIVPQIYFGYENKVCPFDDTLSQWDKIVKSDDVKLICGLAMYKIESEDEFTDNTGIIAQQMSDVSAQNGYSGTAVYSLKSLLGESDRLKDEREAVTAQLSKNNS